MSDSYEAMRRFRASMVMDFDKWHDGIPYDIAALDEMTPAEREGIAAELAARRELDWRDVEALRHIGTPEALARIAEAAGAQQNHGGAAALSARAECGWTEEIEDRFLTLLESARLMETSFDRLFEVAERNPTPRVQETLLRLATRGDESVRYAFAAFLLYLHGQADEWYGLDEGLRPHLLKLSGSAGEQREAQLWLNGQVASPIRGRDDAS